MKRTVIAVAVAVGIAAAGGVAIYAASGSVTNDNGPNGGPGGGQMIVGGPMPGMSDTKHGEFQVGEITEISDDSITAMSEDGYEQTYAIDDDTEITDDLEKGDDVTIIATTDDGDTPTARSVMEVGTAQGGPRRNDGNGGNGGPPNGGNGDSGSDSGSDGDSGGN